MDGNERFPHTLVPLSLAVVLIRDEVHCEGQSVASDLNDIATFIAASVPLYEYANSSRIKPRLLVNVHRDAVFRDGGRELLFLDGRPPKRLLGVQADDVTCLIAMLREPQRAAAIRRQAIRRAARRLVEESRKLKRELRDRSEVYRQLCAQARQIKPRETSVRS